MNGPLWILMEREFKTRFARKGYWVFTVVGVVLLVALTFLPSIINLVNGVSTRTVIMDDPKGLLGASVSRLIAANPKGYDFKLKVDDTPGVLSLNAHQMSEYMDSHHTSLVVTVAGNSAASAEFTLQERGSVNPTVVAQLESAVKQAVTLARLSELPPATQARLSQPVRFATHQWKSGSKSMDQMIQATVLVYCMLIMLFATMMTYGAWVAQGVVEEKTNRIVEMMLVTAKPWQILFGKVLGIGLVGLVQYVIWLAVLGVGLTVRKQLSSLPLSHIPASTFVLLPIFFILGYFLYASLYAIAGSLVNRPEEQQMALTPVVLCMVILFYISLFGVLPQPDSTFAAIVSFIPILTPMTMFTRAVMTTVPTWQIVIGIGLTILLNLLMIRYGAAVYRRFALRNTGKASWTLLWKKDMVQLEDPPLRQ
ncbi:MAG: ABC transporter permease [Alicyclobacillus sp.]|nr:ABC transporter permease [Alicyclobacillus sp.]